MAIGAGALVEVLNWIVLVVAAAAVFAVGMVNRCPGHTPYPSRAEIEAELDPVTVYNYIYELNIISNFFFFLPALVLYVLGFPIEATLILLLAGFSTLWHATGNRAFGVLDILFASLGFVVMLCIFLRVVQVRGWPLFALSYLVVSLVGLLAFGYVRQTGATTPFITDRLCHIIWHVTVALTFLFITLEVARVPALLPNARLARYVADRDREASGTRSASLLWGLFTDLTRRYRKGQRETKQHPEP